MNFSGPQRAVWGRLRIRNFGGDNPLVDSYGIPGGFDVDPGWRYASDPLGRLADYEAGRLGPEATTDLFQSLVDTDLVWGLRSEHILTAIALLDVGLVHL